jgi:hypothetical protein
VVTSLLEASKVAVNLKNGTMEYILYLSSFILFDESIYNEYETGWWVVYLIHCLLYSIWWKRL